LGRALTVEQRAQRVCSNRQAGGGEEPVTSGLTSARRRC